MYHTLIAADIDGTLITDYEKGLDERLFALIPRLAEKGVLFCAASGRAYSTLHKMFGSVADDMAFLAENGAEICYGKNLLKRISMPAPLCRSLCEYLSRRSDCCARVNTGVAHYYLVQDDRVCEDEYANAVTVKHFDEVEGEVTQITAVSYGDIEAPAKEILRDWGGRTDVFAAVTGEHWLDFTCAGKDVGLRWLCEHCAISMEDTIAFGDNYNDVPMLEAAARGYIMDGACAELRSRFALHTDSVVDTLLAWETTLK